MNHYWNWFVHLMHSHEGKVFIHAHRSPGFDSVTRASFPPAWRTRYVDLRDGYEF